MKISVIVPVYNVERYVRKCLFSLVNQTLVDLEILVINDGSTDRSPEIIETFREQYPQKIKVFHLINGGLGAARNYGIEKAKGQYIGFVDGDDYVALEMFEDLYRLAISHRAEIAMCNLQKVDEKGALLRKLPQSNGFPEKIDLAQHFSIFGQLSYFACNKIFKKELFENQRFHESIHFEDIALIPQLLLASKILAKTDRYSYHYVQRKQSITQLHSDRGFDMIKAIELVEQAFVDSAYANHKKALEGFQILQGAYSFLAYASKVKDPQLFNKFLQVFWSFVKKREISVKKIIKYYRFNENYLLSLTYEKIIYYLLCFFNQETLLRKLL